MICALLPFFMWKEQALTILVILLGISSGIALSGSYQLVSYFPASCNVALTAGKSCPPGTKALRLGCDLVLLLCLVVWCLLHNYLRLPGGRSIVTVLCFHVCAKLRCESYQHPVCRHASASQGMFGPPLGWPTASAGLWGYTWVQCLQPETCTGMS